MNNSIAFEEESLRVEEHIEGIGELIFEWNRSYNVKVYDPEETFTKEFILNNRTASDLYDLIDYIERHPEELSPELSGWPTPTQQKE